MIWNQCHSRPAEPCMSVFLPQRMCPVMRIMNSHTDYCMLMSLPMPEGNNKTCCMIDLCGIIMYHWYSSIQILGRRSMVDSWCHIVPGILLQCVETIRPILLQNKRLRRRGSSHGVQNSIRPMDLQVTLSFGNLILPPIA